MTKCTLTIHDQGPPGYPAFTIAVTFSYDAGAVQVIKQRIPSAERTYVFDTQTWWVHPRWQGALEAFAQGFSVAELVEGDWITGLHTGMRTRDLPQMGLFEEA